MESAGFEGKHRRWAAEAEWAGHLFSRHGHRAGDRGPHSRGKDGRSRSHCSHSWSRWESRSRLSGQTGQGRGAGVGRKGLQLIMDAKLQNSGHLAASTASGRERKARPRCLPPPSLPAVPGGLRLGAAESAEGQAPGPRPGAQEGSRVGGPGAWGAWARPVPQGGGGRRAGAGRSCHVAQEMAALCSLAFMRRAAMLEVLRSGSPLSS